MALHGGFITLEPVKWRVRNVEDMDCKLRLPAVLFSRPAC